MNRLTVAATATAVIRSRNRAVAAARAAAIAAAATSVFCLCRIAQIAARVFRAALAVAANDRGLDVVTVTPVIDTRHIAVTAAAEQVC